jgi:hypothetical protein
VQRKGLVAAVRNWSLITACAKQAPIPHADVSSLRGYRLIVASPPFTDRANQQSVDDEMAQGKLPWTMSAAPSTCNP